MSVVDTSMFGTEPFPTLGGAGPAANPGLKQWAGRTVEKLRAAVAGGLRFLPRLDNYTEETVEIRAAYRLMLREPVLKSAHKTKVEAVAQLDWQVLPADRKSARDVDIADCLKHCLKLVSGRTVRIARSVLGGALLDGFSVTEKKWDRVKRGKYAGKWCWAALKSKDTKNLTLGTDAFRNVTSVRPMAYGIGTSFEPSDFLIYTYGSLFESALGTSDHRAAYGSFWFKDTVKRLWGLHLDKYVSPVLKGTYSTYDQKLALEEALEQARSDTWLTIPVGATVEAVQLASRGEAEFEAACDYQDRQMLIATAGAYLQTLEGKISDGRGDTSIHRDSATLFQWGLAADLQSVVNEQLVPEWVELNYAGADCPEVVLGSVSDADLKTSLDVDKGLQEMGFRHSREKLAEYYGREEATDPSDALTPAGGGDQPPQGMRERFRRFAEWEERDRPFDRFCGGQGGKPGPCPAGGGAGGGKPAHAAAAAHDAAERMGKAVEAAKGRKEMAAALAAVGREAGAAVRQNVAAAAQSVKAEELSGYKGSLRRDLGSVVSGHAAEFGNDVVSDVNHHVNSAVGQLRHGDAREGLRLAADEARADLSHAGSADRWALQSKFLHENLKGVLVANGRTPEAAHAEADRLTAALGKRLGVTP